METQPTRNSRRVGALVLMLFLIGCLGVFAYTVLRQRTQALEAALAAAATHAHNIEEQLTQSLQVVELVMGSLQSDGPPNGQGIDFGAAARAALRTAPYLRSLSLTDLDGRVIASSTPGNQGQGVDLRDIFPAGEPEAEVLRIAAPRPGRDVGAGARSSSGAAGDGADGLSVIPLVRRVSATTHTPTAWAVAAINPDHFVHRFRQQLDPAEGYVQWLRYDGSLLASSRPEDKPGTRGLAADVQARLPQRETGRFQQTLADGTAVLTAYRASSLFPALIVVNLDRDRVLAGWQDDTRQMALVVLPAVAALAIVGLLVLRWQAQTDRQQAGFRRQLQLAASVFEASSEAIVLTAPDGRIISCNPAFLRLTDREAPQVVGRLHHEVASGGGDDGAYQRMWEDIRRDGHWQGEISDRRLDGSQLIAQVTVTSVHDEHGRLHHHVVVTRDITELKRAEAAKREAERQREQQFIERQRLLELSVRDSLTGLYNRRYLDETLPRELARVKREGHPLAVVMVDIDHFKRINDTHGHAAGDQVIRAMGQLLGASAREGDVVSRHGGEEFVVVMPGMTAAAALERAQRWGQQVAELRVMQGLHEIRFSMSSGVAAYPVHGADADALLRAADRAMYSAKAAGRDRAVEATQLE